MNAIVYPRCRKEKRTLFLELPYMGERRADGRGRETVGKADNGPGLRWPHREYGRISSDRRLERSITVTVRAVRETRLAVGDSSAPPESVLTPSVTRLLVWIGLKFNHSSMQNPF